MLKKIKRLRCGFCSPSLVLEELRAMRVSYSQFGEDLIVREHFQGLDNTQGRFLDVGAFHPFKFSNTILLSQLGWRGVNIDCDPGKIRLFHRLRPQDENVCAAVAAVPGEMIWLEYPEGTTNRLVAREEQNRLSAIGECAYRETLVQVRTLSEIIDQTAFKDARFHYLNIDCEGHDLGVLQGLDFSRYAPDLISVEALTPAAKTDLCAFLETRGYELTDKVQWTLFFRRLTL
jgi:FkbM family methyltransferase